MIFVNYPGHFVAVVLLLLSAGLVFLAFRSAELQKAKLRLYRPLLMLLQYVLIFVLLLILWNPSRPKTSKNFSQNSVLVAFDTSESMSLREDGQTTRLDKAIKLLEQRFGSSGPQGPEYRVFGFDKQVYHGGSTDLLRRWGTQTNMHRVLDLLRRYDLAEGPPPPKISAYNDSEAPDKLDEDESAEQSQVAGAIIFTDGQAHDKNIDSYLALRNKDFPVLFVGIGSKKPQRDLAIKSVSVPSRVMVDTTYEVKAVVAAEGLRPSQPLTIELLEDGYVIDSKQLATDGSLKGGANNLTTEFTVVADEIGGQTLSIRVKPVEGEANSANNLWTTMVEAVARERVKALLYSRQANFSIGKIRQVLARDDRIRLDLGLDVIRTPGLAEKAAEMSGYVKLPDDRDGFYEYDIIILGPCELDNLTQAQVDGLYTFVAEKGGGLILLAGRGGAGPASWRSAKARALLPVLFDHEETTAHPSGPGEIEVTYEGIDSKIVGPADFKDYERQSSPYYNISRAKPAATTLANVDKTPIICLHRIGRGRVCLLNVSRLFLWYRQDRQGGLLYKVISGLTGHLNRTAGPGAGVELFAERTGGETDKITFSSYVCDKSFSGVAGANVLLSVKDDVLYMNELGRGYYVVEVEDVGSRTIVATVQAESNGTLLGEKSIAVNLPPAPSEMTDVVLDERFLRTLAKKMNGQYFHAQDVPKNVVEMFEARRFSGTSTRMESIWPKWLLLATICFLLTASWFLRRRIGLV
ncbi:MAG: vWA domain-containing protein [Planctomycetota bacterium]|jgi:hypothetical protein